MTAAELYYGAAAAPSQFFGQPVVALQLVTAGASIGRVSTSNYIVSRNYNALALGAVAVEFAVKYFSTGRTDDLTAQLVLTYRADDWPAFGFTTPTLRTVLILQINALDRSLFACQITSAVALAICVACTIAVQNIVVYPFPMVPLLPVVGVGLGCPGEASNNMVMWRRCIFAMGCILRLLAYETTAWGLMPKSALNRDTAEFCLNDW